MTRSEKKRLDVQRPGKGFPGPQQQNEGWSTKKGTKLGKKLPVSLVWMATFTKPEGMSDWEFYRVEYGGHAMSCLTEGGIWLPCWANSRDLEEYLMRTQRRSEPSVQEAE